MTTVRTPNHWLVAVAAMMTLFAGCRTVNTVGPAGADPAPIADTRIITDPSLSQQASVVALYEDQTNTGLTRIAAEVYNRTRQLQRVQYRFEWFDAAGMPIDTPQTGWRDLVLAGKERSRIFTVAPEGRATDWRLKLIQKQ